MVQQTEIKGVVKDFPLFKSLEEKEKFFLILGLLVLRQISSAKAAELMDMEREEFLFLLSKLGIEYAFLMEEDIKSEKEAISRLLKELKK